MRDRPTVPPGVSWRRIVLPTEHGGWAFLAEPIVLGLAVAFSGAGLLLGVMAIAGFLARQPLKLLVLDRRRGKAYPRTVAALRAFAILATAALLALAGAGAAGGWRALPFLALASPLVTLTLALDLGKGSREVAAELIAPITLGAVAPAIALAGGWSLAAALGLWGILIARSVPSILYVRARLRLERGEPAQVAGALAAQIAACAWAAWLAWRGLAPVLGVAVITLLGARAAWGLSRWRPRMTTRQLGASEAVLSAVTVLAIVLGIRIGGRAP